MRYVPRTVLTAFAFLAMTTGLSFAQTAATNPVGTVTLTILRGQNAIGPSLANTPIFQSAIVSTAGSTITFSTAGGPVNLATVLQSGTRYYVEIAKPSPAFATFVGDVLEIDVPATIASANGVLTVKSAGFNTLATPLPDLTGYSALIRPHVTLGQVFGTQGNVLLKAATTTGKADQIRFYNKATANFTTYWFRTNSTGTIVEWRSLDNSADVTDYSTLPIEPGIGVYVLRRANPTVNISFVGCVRTNDLQQPLTKGYNLVAQGLPYAHSPAQMKMNRSGGFVPGISAGSADQIRFVDPATGGYITYWLRTDASGSIEQWRSLDSADTTDYMNKASFFYGGKAMYLVKTTAADPNYFYPITALHLGN